MVSRSIISATSLCPRFPNSDEHLTFQCSSLTVLSWHLDRPCTRCGNFPKWPQCDAGTVCHTDICTRARPNMFQPVLICVAGQISRSLRNNTGIIVCVIGYCWQKVSDKNLEQRTNVLWLVKTRVKWSSLFKDKRSVRMFNRKCRHGCENRSEEETGSLPWQVDSPQRKSPRIWR